MTKAADLFEGSGVKQRRFAELVYGAKSWNRVRRVIARLEHGPKGANPRFVVTNLAGQGRDLYDHLYCARGEMENRIKEQQLQLFSDRTSCHRWWPNQFRLLLASLAYTLMNTIWTHPGKVEAPYTVCIASASNLTGLVKSSVECRRTGL